MTAPLAYDFSRAKTDEGDWADACEGYSFCQGPRCCKDTAPTRADKIRVLDRPSHDRYAEKLWREASAPEGGQLYPRPRKRERVGFWQALWRFVGTPWRMFFGD